MTTIEEYRRDHGITVSAASRALNVTRPTYYKYERDMGKIPLRLYLQLCAFYGVGPSYFLPEVSSLTLGKED